MKRMLVCALLAALLCAAGAMAEEGLTWTFITPEPEVRQDVSRPDLPVGPEGDAYDGAAEPEGDDYDDDAYEDVQDAAPAQEGITYPVQAEVVNCKSGVSLRSQPSTKATLLCEVPLGEWVAVYGNQAWQGNDRWFVEAAYKGQKGYICIEYLDIILPEELRYQRDYLKGTDGIVSAVNPGTDLILRAGPGTGYDSLGLLFGGEVLGYLGEAKLDGSGTCWYHCSHYGEDCWISAKFTALTLDDGMTYTGGRGIF